MKEIDERVFGLYRLTEEIEIVKRAAIKLKAKKSLLLIQSGFFIETLVFY